MKKLIKKVEGNKNYIFGTGISLGGIYLFVTEYKTEGLCLISSGVALITGRANAIGKIIGKVVK